MSGKGGKTGADRDETARGEKARRLAEALRANLRRRKAQARERRQEPDPADATGDEEPGMGRE